MKYPLEMSFKILALAPQIYLKDRDGQPLLYVRQKLLKLREAIQVFRDDSRSHELFQINADRIIDFSANYRFTDSEGNALGSVKRRGARSIWRATYEVSDRDGQPLFEIREDNPWTKLLDATLGEIPVIGAFTGYFLNPSYTVHRGGTEVLQVIKHRSFLESRFEIQHRGGEIGGVDEATALLAILMMVLLERSRG